MKPIFTAMALLAAGALLLQCEIIDGKDAPRPPEDSVSTTFTCQGKTTCPEMISCAEAIYYLQHCPDVTIDGDGDGIPCESQWCLP